MSYEFFTHSNRTAAKDHRCEQCRGIISKGERHSYCAGKFDGDFYAYREHFECREAWLKFSEYALEFEDSAPFLADADSDSDSRAPIIEQYPAVAARLGWVRDVSSAHKTKLEA